MYNVLRAWGLMSRYLDDPRGEAPMFASSSMIMMKTLNPHQKANTRDPEIRNPALKGGEGSYLSANSLKNLISFLKTSEETFFFFSSFETTV